MERNKEQEQRIQAGPQSGLAASREAMTAPAPQKAPNTVGDSSAPPPAPRFETLQREYPGPYEP
jgi:hypothetical protein